MKIMNAESTAADLFSKRVSIPEGSVISFHVEWTGTTQGVLKLQFSNKPDPVESTSDDWVTDATAAFPYDPGGSAGSTLEHWSGCGARWVRVWYDRTGGSGTMSIWTNQKDD